MKKALLLGLLVCVNLFGCQAARTKKQAQAQEQALAAALPLVREWVRHGKFAEAEFLVDLAHVDDLGDSWHVAVPLATLNPSRVSNRFRGATFSVNKATGEVQWLGIER